MTECMCERVMVWVYVTVGLCNSMWEGTCDSCVCV